MSVVCVSTLMCMHVRACVLPSQKEREESESGSDGDRHIWSDSALGLLTLTVRVRDGVELESE